MACRERGRKTGQSVTTEQDPERKIHKELLDEALPILGGGETQPALRKVLLVIPLLMAYLVHKNWCVVRESGLPLRLYHTLAAVCC